MDLAPPIEVSASDQIRLGEIGRFRLEVWRQETAVNEALFPKGEWIEALDTVARHWIFVDDLGLVAAARLTIHQTLNDNPDGYLWARAGRSVPLPAGHFCKLVVAKRARGRGLGKRLNATRIEAARASGAKSILVTASEANCRLLLTQGFTDTGIREIFANRPTFEFRALQCLL